MAHTLVNFLRFEARRRSHTEQGASCGWPDPRSLLQRRKVAIHPVNEVRDMIRNSPLQFVRASLGSSIGASALFFRFNLIAVSILVYGCELYNAGETLVLQLSCNCCGRQQNLYLRHKFFRSGMQTPHCICAFLSSRPVRRKRSRSTNYGKEGNHCNCHRVRDTSGFGSELLKL